ncbi:MlaD family protein [Pectinatus cerevisiiphilus]|uniref:Phospholipid/cholesterol/gamma-HCH transport system substrate-binding protein n=1 Tax=Pectinatus cerevisiiphilus TaxID=86956 RepID=A0A4R3KCX6_9FIRM|nr:MlaD family protein [Pectinatus cerevisiiphilus]TCS80501.1 phospholipid/cholesterol/gamma-HCH transport system substrate-binding protein [Pectinatus cerevisiiphilus]
MTTEAKVGLFTMLALALALVIVVQLGHISFGEAPRYKITASFKYVDGLKPGALVRYAGVDIGNVRTVTTDGSGANVVLEIKNDIKVPKKSTVTISSDGLMGEKFVNIYSDGTGGDDYLAAGDTVQGTEERNITSLMASVSDTLDKVDKMVTSVNTVIGNPQVQDSLIESAVNLKNITGNIDQATAVIARMAGNNEGNVNEIVHNMVLLTASMQRTSSSVETMVKLNGDGQVTDNVRTAASNLASTSTRIENMAANLEPVIADPQTAEDLRSVLHNANAVSKKADNMMTKISSIKTKVGVDALYSGKKSDMMLNADLKIYNNPNDFLLIGGDDIGGDDPATNLQVGSGNNFFSGRIGLFDNKAGIGIDTYSGPWRFSVDAYDMDDIRVKFRGQYRLAPDTYLLGQVNDVNSKADRTTYLGIRREF